MNAPVAFVAACLSSCVLLAAGCSDTPQRLPVPIDGSSTDDGGVFGPGTNGLMPSGALVRVVNAYDPLDGPPGSIELYPNAFSLPGHKPLVSVAYGTASVFFDPTVGEGGHMALSMYQSGETGNGNSVIATTQTLSGGEVITYLLAAASTSHPSGRRNGTLRTILHDRNMPPTIAGQGQIVVDAIGMENISPNTTSDRLSLRLKDQCMRATNDSPSSRTPLFPGTQIAYDIAPGQYDATLFRGDDCIGSTLVQVPSVQIEMGKRTLLFLYATADAAYRGLSLPLEPKMVAR